MDLEGLLDFCPEQPGGWWTNLLKDKGGTGWWRVENKKFSFENVKFEFQVEVSRRLDT